MENYKYIENNTELNELYNLIKDSNKFAFDCEFDKKSEFNKKLSLISINVKNQIFIIDCLKTDYYSGFVELLSDKEIIKITHSGQSDYDIFRRKTNTLPQNTIDSQILAFFCSQYGPLDLKNLLNKFLDIEIEKDMSASDWMKRPLNSIQLKYAAKDVEYLIDLVESIFDKLPSENKDWALQKCMELSKDDTYCKNPLYELLSNRELNKYNQQEIIFLLRITEWQLSLDEISKKEIFKPRLISDLLRTIGSGRETMLKDTRIKKSKIVNYIDDVIEMYQAKPTNKELTAYNSILLEKRDKIKRSNALNFIELLIHDRCNKRNIVPKIVISKKDLILMKNIKGYAEIFLEKSWRRNIVGDEIISLINKVDYVDIKYSMNKIEIKLLEEKW